jgi:MoxR-like ATPase
MKVVVDSSEREESSSSSATGEPPSVETVLRRTNSEMRRKPMPLCRPGNMDYAPARAATATLTHWRHDGARHRLWRQSSAPSTSYLLLALAFMRGRAYVLPSDVQDVALDVMRHRLILSYEALSDGVTSDTIIESLLRNIPAPRVPLEAMPDAER